MQDANLKIWIVAVILAAAAVLFVIGIYAWALRKRIHLLQRVLGTEREREFHDRSDSGNNESEDRPRKAS